MHHLNVVIPTNAGTQPSASTGSAMGSSLRGKDEYFDNKLIILG
jgi:hypothetical protein